MSTENENIKKVDESESEDAPAAEPKKPEEHMIPKSRLDEVIAERDAANKKASAMEKAAQDAEKKRLKEQEDYKTLYEGAEAQIAEYKPKAEKLEVYEATLKETLAAQIEQIPEDKRSLIPDELSTVQQLKWIAKNRALLSVSAAVDIGAGKRGGSETTSVNLTAEEQAVARKFKMTDEEYAKHK